MSSIATDRLTGDRAKPTRPWTKRLLIAALVAILVTTLYPFDFSIQATSAKRTNSFLHWLSGKPVGSISFGLNCVLFFPLGFALACRAREKGWRRLPALAAALGAGAALSFAIEFAQLFIPPRDSSWSDVIANALGSGLGYFFYQPVGDLLMRWASSLEAAIERIFSLRLTLACFLVYILLACIVSAPLQRPANLSNWEQSYPLLIGNDPTGSHPWHGRVFWFGITNHALPDKRAKEISAAGSLPRLGQSWLASYQFPESLDSAAPAGQPMALSWIPAPPQNPREGELVLTGTSWLGTREPASALLRELQRTNQLTLAMRCATADVSGIGGGRIISLAQDTDRIDLAVGQEEEGLSVRLRTPLTGERALPPLHLPSVFGTAEARTLVMTYNGSILRVYADGRRVGRPFSLGPGARLFSLFFPLTPERLDACNWGYAALVFFPLGLLLALAIRQLHPSWSAGLLVAACIFLPSLLLDAVLAAVSGRTLDLGNILLGICMIGGAALFANADLRRPPLHRRL